MLDQKCPVQHRILRSSCTTSFNSIFTYRQEDLLDTSSYTSANLTASKPSLLQNNYFRLPRTLTYLYVFKSAGHTPPRGLANKLIPTQSVQSAAAQG